jgi:uncharacterized protein YlxW (UPF0749 family)
MDYEKKIQNLLSENEFLQEQLEELNSEIRKKDEVLSSIHMHSEPESEASLRSRIEGNRLEIEQIRYNMEETVKKAAAIEMLNEELEVSLLRERKARQKDAVVINDYKSTQANMDILNEELSETANLYKKVKAYKSEVAELRSERDLLKIDNMNLLIEIQELKSLVAHLRKK